MSPTLKSIAFAAAGLIGTASAANAAVIFNETYDAQRIFDEGTYGDRTASISGSNILFGTSNSGTHGAEFLELSIFGAGILSASEQYTVTVSVTENRALGTSDQDTIFAVGDDTNQIGIQHSDNNAGRFTQFYGEINTSGVVDSVATFNGAPINTGLAFDTWQSVIQVGVVDSISSSVPVSDPEFFSLLDIDPSLGLSFRGFANNASETYALTSITITVEGPDIASVPAPGALLLLGFGMLGLGLRRRTV